MRLHVNGEGFPCMQLLPRWATWGFDISLNALPVHHRNQRRLQKIKGTQDRSMPDRSCNYVHLCYADMGLWCMVMEQ